MELREVRSFLSLAEELHFGRTARLLNLSQPALTKQIHRLEAELGGALLVRGKHGAQLSTLGRLFQENAQGILREWDELIIHTQRVARGEGGRLRLGFGFHTFELVPRIIVRLRKRFPTVDLSLRDMSTTEQIEALLAEKIDLGFIRVSSNKNLTVMPVIEDRMMLVTSTALQFPSNLKLETLRHEPFVLISRQRSPTFHRHVLELCSQHGFHPRIVQEVPEITTVVALVRAGLGVSMIPESFGSNQFEGIRFHRFRDKAASWKVAAAWRKNDPNPLISRFLELLRVEKKIAIRSKPIRIKPRLAY